LRFGAGGDCEFIVFCCEQQWMNEKMQPFPPKVTPTNYWLAPMMRAIAFIALMSWVGSIFGGEPPIYHDTLQKAAEAFTHSPASFEFTAVDSPPHITTFRPSRVEQAVVAISDSKSAIVFANSAPVAVHGGLVTVALLALLKHEERGWRIQSVPVRLQAYGDEPNITFTLHEPGQIKSLPQKHLSVTIDGRDGKRTQNYFMTDGQLLEVK
jgi:hypothetical protein